jgi:hypothetical protein
MSNKFQIPRRWEQLDPYNRKIKSLIIFGFISVLLTTSFVSTGYSQPQQGVTQGPAAATPQPQSQPQQQPQSGQAELTRLQKIEDNIQKLLAQLDVRRGQIESQLSPPPELTPKPAPLNQQQTQEYFKLLQDITNRQQQLLDQLQKLDLQIQQVQQPALRQPPPGATQILEALPQQQLQQLPPAQQQPGQAQPAQQIPGQQPPAQQQLAQQPPVPVTVKFISIKVNNDRDPNIPSFIQNDGEYLLDAFVNGEKVSLGTKGGLLWDVRGGASPYRFPQTAQITVNVPRDGFLTINTVGSEVDGCGNTITLPTKLPKQVTDIAQKAGIPGVSTVSKYLDTLLPAFGLPIPPAAQGILATLGLNSLLNPTALASWAACKVDPNDTIGEVNQVYPGPDFGRGLKTVESDTGYWVLSYEIQPSV